MLMGGIDTEKLSAAYTPKYYSDSAGRRGFMWKIRGPIKITVPPAVEDISAEKALM